MAKRAALFPTVAIIGTRGYPSYYGGFETAVRKLAPFLAERSFHVTVYGRKEVQMNRDRPRDARVESVITWGIESKSLSTLSYGLFAVLHATWRKPDVVLIMNVANGFWIPFLRLRRIPVVVNVDGIEWERQKWGQFAKGIFWLGAKFAAWFANELVADSVEIQKRWKSAFGRNSTFIPYGGDAAQDLPIESGLEHGRYVLFVARFVPENTVIEFLEAAESLAVDWPIVIVGSSGYEGKLDERARNLADSREKVQWFGHVSDDARLASLWQHTGAYFHGHSVGGTNPALVQAMALGAPTVARDTRYNREVLGDGAVFVGANSVAIIEGLVNLLSDSELRDKLASTAMARARHLYTWEAVCMEYESLLLEVVHNVRR